MIFRLPWVAGYITPEGLTCAQGYSETFDRANCTGCAEICQDDDVTISPYYGPARDRKHLDQRVFVGWPRGPKWTGYYNVALSHVIDWKFHERTKNTLTRVYLLGMTEAATQREQAAAVLPIAKAWLKSPEIKVASKGRGYKSLGFDRIEKAWIVEQTTADAGPLTLEIAATKDRPAINPCIIVRNFGARPVSFRQNAREIKECKDLRIGLEKRKDRTDLVIWRRAEVRKTVRFSVSMRE